MKGGKEIYYKGRLEAHFGGPQQETWSSTSETAVR